jgi:signal transduction histidine kinase
MKFRRSIKLNLIIPLLIILTIVFFSSSLVIIDREAQEARASIIINAESYSSLSVKDIIDNYEIFYESGFYKFTEEIKNLMYLNRDLSGIQLVDINGKILFDSNEIVEGKYNEKLYETRYIENNETIEQIRKPIKTVNQYEENVKNFDIIEPYFNQYNVHQYSVIYYFSFKYLDEQITNIYFEIILFSLILIIISFLLIFYILSKLITIPISKLNEGVKRIASGKFGYTIKIKNKNEIGDLTSSINTMSLDLKESIHKHKKLLEQKNQFINHIGHDLKNPIGPLKTLIPILQESEKDYEKNEMLNVIIRNVDYLNNLVIKTLDFSRINSTEQDLSFEDINLNDEIKKIVKNKDYLLKEKKIKVQYNILDDYVIKVDRFEFEKLIFNIIENAIIYNIENGKIIINAEKKDEKITVSFQDTGIGMTKDQINQAFNEFYKVDSSRHDFKSTGLGLSICKKIIEKHNGRIWIESLGLNKGITVFFTLPLDPTKK